MPPRKRTAASETPADEPLPKRRSLRSATRQQTNGTLREVVDSPVKTTKTKETKANGQVKKEATKRGSTASKTLTKKSASEAAKPQDKSMSEDIDVDVDSIPTTNPNAPRHDGEWYWLMKAEPETRMENGIDVRFSINDLRAKEKPEGWDGIRAYAARNNMRNMNAGDKAFFYHSNCKAPAIVGIMEIVKEYSEDTTARQPGTPYYDPSSTKDKPRWDLVHVEFRTKFAVPIYLTELRELGKPGQPLEEMQMLKQSRLSVSRVSGSEWKALCELADEKAQEAGREHES